MSQFLSKIVWKIPFKENQKVDGTKVFKVFNEWIPNSPEVFVDVADYRHVEDGPLYILVGHFTDYSIDHSDRRLGFRYSRKRGLEGDSASNLKQSFSEMLQKFIQAENELGFDFDMSEIHFSVNERSYASNNQEGFQIVEALLKDFFNKVYGESAFDMEQIGDSRQLLTVAIKPKVVKSLQEIKI